MKVIFKLRYVFECGAVKLSERVYTASEIPEALANVEMCEVGSVSVVRV